MMIAAANVRFTSARLMTVTTGDSWLPLPLIFALVSLPWLFFLPQLLTNQDGAQGNFLLIHHYYCHDYVLIIIIKSYKYLFVTIITYDRR